MADDVLVCVADGPLCDVIELGLALDGHRVWSVADEAGARRVLAGRTPDLLLLDGTMSLSEATLAWVDRYAPQTPAVVFMARGAPVPEPSRPDVGLLIMPFGRADRLRCIAAVRAAHARDRGMPGRPSPSNDR
jgi:DNA-binding NtrC family response regulator